MTESGVEAELDRMLNSLTEQQKRELDERRAQYTERLYQMMEQDLPRVRDKRIMKALAYGYITGYQRAIRDFRRH